MSTLQTYITQVQRLVHDASGANFSTSELTDYINEAREDVALDMHCVRTFFTGVQLLPSQEIYSIEGAIVGANVTAGGNYTTAPTVTFDAAPAGGVTATGTAVMIGTAVTAINMTTWGDDYIIAPNITFSPPGAAATPIFFNNLFQVNFISNVWNGERYMLNYRAFTLFNAYFRSWQFNSRPGVWTIHQQMLQVYLRPLPDQLYISEWDVLCLPAPLVNLTDVDAQVMPPWNKAVQFRAAALALMKNQNFEQAQFYESKYDQRVPKYIMGAGGIRIPNPYNRSFQRRVSRG
jgi:hypothetical protein